RIPCPPRPTLFPYTTLFRSRLAAIGEIEATHDAAEADVGRAVEQRARRGHAAAGRPYLDVQPLGGEVTAVERHELRRIEDRAERLIDGQRLHRALMSLRGDGRGCPASSHVRSRARRRQRAGPSRR